MCAEVLSSGIRYARKYFAEKCNIWNFSQVSSTDIQIWTRYQQSLSVVKPIFQCLQFISWNPINTIVMINRDYLVVHCIKFANSEFKQMEKRECLWKCNFEIFLKYFNDLCQGNGVSVFDQKISSVRVPGILAASLFQPYELFFDLVWSSLNENTFVKQC